MTQHISVDAEKPDSHKKCACNCSCHQARGVNLKCENDAEPGWNLCDYCLDHCLGYGHNDTEEITIIS